jgi:hypothetical protein
MRRRPWPTVLAVCLAAPLPVFSAPPATPAGKPVDFDRDVRPILSENCFACHGPDRGKRKGKLRLDTKEDAFADRGGYHVLVPGKPADSELYKRVTETDTRRRMPPRKFGKALTPEQVTVLRHWIEQGARWQQHWSLVAPARPALPRVRDEGWTRNAVDRFVLARLEREGLLPSPEADRRTLIRRLSFDLTGLPPTPKEVDDFLADTSPDAYEKVVDRLLASRHYGERMALYWLDLVRFGDTGGYHSDNHRDVYLFRDYVIDAFNTNKSFADFTVEQLAGDLLPGATREQKIASGYNRLLMTTEEGGAQPKEYMAKYAADRVRNASGVWLGLTLGCCECHSHKFDPFTQKEFYSFASFWADVKERAVGRQDQVKLPTREQSLRLQYLDEQIAATNKALAKSTPAVSAGQARWEALEKARLAKGALRWAPVKPAKVASSGGSTLVVQDDSSVLATGTNPAKDTYTVTLKTDAKNITAVRLSALTHPSLAGGGLSRANGNFVLTRFTVTASSGGKKAPVKIVRALADYSQPGFPVASLLTGKGTPGWAVDGHSKRGSRTAVFVFAEPLPGGPGTTLRVRLEHHSPFAGHNIGRFRLDLTSAENPTLGGKDGLPGPVAEALEVEPGKRSPAQKEALAKYYRTIAPELAEARAKLARLEQEKKAIERKLPQTLISESVPPRVMRVLPRGNWMDDSGEVVSPGVPGALSPLKVSGRRATRLDLAKWLVAPEHPLTARVFVNRLWKLTFGQGLVTTLDDFGSQGARPTHPELLDWLAVEFRESGWDVKHMMKLLVMSSAYRQTSAAGEGLRQRDPYNKLLARQGRFRLDAEVVRDNALAVSGLLVRHLGGPSVKPYQPAGYWQYLNFPTRTYVADTGPNQYRRGVYTYWQRTFPHPSLVAFDAPSREECTAERPRSNTPLQALVLLNDPTYVEAARVLAERVLTKGGAGVEDRVQYAYREVLARKAHPEEVKLLAALFEKHLGQYKADPKAADELLGIGQAPVGKDVDRPALGAWTSVARVLLNLHETITRE